MKVNEVDLNDYALYSGKYTGYGDDELMEVIDTEFFTRDDDLFSNYTIGHMMREDLIHNGKLLHFREINRNLELPPGTVKRLLKDVATRYGLVPLYENEKRHSLQHSPDKRLSKSTTVRNQSRRSGPDGPASYCQKWCLTIDQAAVGTCQHPTSTPSGVVGITASRLAAECDPWSKRVVNGHSHRTRRS